MKKNLLEMNIKKKCAVCENEYMTSELDLTPCPYCGWYNDSMCEENPEKVIYRNLISFNKAKQLYSNKRLFKPNLNEFLEAFEFYGETGFFYQDKDCCLFRGNNENEIEFGWSPENVFYFKNKEDFIQNAKIGDEYVRDIWDKVENPSYL